MNLSSIVSPLLNWFRRNARDLPWRHDVTPYRVLVSEIMLQQTRVDTVIPYFHRFLRELPDLQALANAPEEKLLKLWEGLGYYNRVRNLQKAATAILEKYQGDFPQDYEELRKLPGIGPYTAGAIASIAFHQPVPAVDGNVLRVICRITGSKRNISEPTTVNLIRSELQKVYPKDAASDFTQSLMELGAIQCLPNGKPECPTCPMKELCLAFKEGYIDEIPVKTPPKGRKIEKKTVLLLFHDGKIAVNQRGSTGLLAGLWEFPSLEGWQRRKEITAFLQENNVEFSSLEEAIKAKHIFTHLEWHMHSWKVQCRTAPTQWTWISANKLQEDLPLPSALQAFRQYCQNLPESNATSSPSP